MVILVRPGVATYATGAQGAGSGFEYDLVRRFADERHLKYRIVTVDDDRESLRRLQRGEGHLAIAWATPGDAPDLRSSVSYARSRDLIVTHEDVPPMTRPQQLAGRRVHVIAGSHQEATLRALAARIPQLEVVPQPQLSELELLEKVATREFPAALVSDVAYSIGSNFHPELQDALELRPDRPIVWLFAAGVPADFIAEANDFLRHMETGGELARLRDRYFGHVNRLTSADIDIFIARMRSVLPLYRPFFQAAQLQTGIDWRQLAALAYQESRWDPLATSPTGVRGMMMLTGDTADALGVRNRLDAAQSIRAGAQYLAGLRDALVPYAREPDRLWLAMAAYNVGLGHLNGARYLATTLGANPGSWYEMKKILPLLSKPQYYRRLKSGRGRGGEAVIMTENVRVYADILHRFEAPYDPLKPKSGTLLTWRSFQAPRDTDAVSAER